MQLRGCLHFSGSCTCGRLTLADHRLREKLRVKGEETEKDRERKRETEREREREREKQNAALTIGSLGALSSIVEGVRDH